MTSEMCVRACGGVGSKRCGRVPYRLLLQLLSSICCVPTTRPSPPFPLFFQRTPLHFACEAGSPECVKELLQADASPNVSDQDARTPLHFGENIVTQ